MAEHEPQGPTEEHLVEELVGILWRKRRLRLAEGASRIAAWHLNESRRFFGELALPVELADASRLDSWLIEYCQRERSTVVSTRDAQRHGPVRDKAKLAAALLELKEADRVRVVSEGRRKTINVNPAMVGVKR